MAGYVKIWTTIEYDSWFLCLPLSARGIFLQLIIAAKNGEETGVVWGRSWSSMGSRWGCDGVTVRKLLRRFHDDGKIILSKPDIRPIRIEIINYLHWQRLRGQKDVIECMLKRGIDGEKSKKNLPKQSRTEQNRTEQKKEEEEKSGKPDPPTLVLKREPDKQFRVWFNSEKGQGYINKLCQKLGWRMARMEALSHDAELWLANPDNRRRFKKDWGRFWKNWVDKSIEILADRQRRANQMTAKQEQEHYASHRNHYGGGFKKLGDV